jgi:apolipoprotein N-acyltransferase
MNDASAPAARVGRIAAVADRVAGLSRRRRYGLSFLLGAFGTLALPPAYVLPILYLVFPVLVWMIGSTRGWRGAFWTGWWFGFGWFAASLYWIGNALLVYDDRHAWMVPFAVLGLPAFLAIFTGLAGAFARIGRNHLERALWLAVGWTAMEWLRGHLFTGFPWNLVGYGWLGSSALVQSAAFAGIYGMSLAAVLSAVLPAALALDSRKARAGAAVAAVLLLALPWLAGTVRLSGAPALRAESEGGVGMRIVQAGIRQQDKWRSDRREQNFALHLRLSIEHRPDWVTHIIWPENAATFFIEQEPGLRAAMARVTPLGGLLITGGPRREGPPLKVWNSAFAVDVHGNVVGHYDKSHLVPFGEYAPFREYLPIDKIAPGAVDYSAGPGRATLRLDGLPPFSPLICYEAIFPGEVVERSDRPAWMLNLTNDAWYGVTAGPHQHLAITRIRAVEEGLPLVRAASTGISAVIDPYGREIGRIALARQGVLDFRLPRPVAEPTFYGRFGDGIVAIALALFTVAIAVVRRR